MSQSIDPISAKKALEVLTGIDSLPPEGTAERHLALDAEELREVEYEEMGLPIPPRAVPRPTLGERIKAFLGLGS